MSAWQTFKNGTRQFLKTSCSIYGYFYFKCLIIIGGGLLVGLLPTH